MGFAATLMVFLLAAADVKSLGGEFAATATVETKQGTRSMGFTLIATSPQSVADVLPLKAVLEKGGQQALRNAIQGGSRGLIRLGALEYPVDLVIAEPVEDGERYVVVTTRHLRYEEISEGRESLNHPFTVIAFDVPEFGRGEGVIYTQAALSVDAEGHLKAEQYEVGPGKLKDVRRVK